MSESFGHIVQPSVIYALVWDASGTLVKGNENFFLNNSLVFLIYHNIFVTKILCH
jgi:hypothetical protein